MTSWQILPFTKGHIDPVLKIEQELFTAPWNYHSYENELETENSYSYIAVPTDPNEQDRVIAYICFRILIDEMHLMKIGVAKNWQHTGVATHLFQNSIKIALEKGASTVYLEVRVTNIPAISLYHKLGFDIIGKRPRYYPETGEDALLLMKRIGSP